MCGRARLSSDVGEIKLVFSIPSGTAEGLWAAAPPFAGAIFPSISKCPEAGSAIATAIIVLPRLAPRAI
jgi:hypothetical protein